VKELPGQKEPLVSIKGRVLFDKLVNCEVFIFILTNDKISKYYAAFML
jgi:hypothetical protein